MLTETQRISVPEQLFSGYSLATIPASEDSRPGEGLLLAVRRSSRYVVTDHTSDSSTLWVRLQLAGSSQPPLLLGASYIPPATSRQLREGASLAERLDSLTVAALGLPESPVLVGGDFNAHLSPPDTHGRALVAACQAAGLCVCTGRTPGDEASPPSYRGTQRTQPTRPDHLLARDTAQPFLLEARVCPDQFPGLSDHYPIEAQLQLQCQPLPSVRCSGMPLPRRAWQQTAQTDYAQALSTHPALAASGEAAQQDDPGASMQQLYVAIGAAADASGMLARTAPAPAQPRPGRAFHQPFFDEECKQRKREVWAASPAERPQLERAYHSLVRRKARAYRAGRLHFFLEGGCLQQRSFWRQLRRPGSHLPDALQNVQAWAGFMQTASDAQLWPGHSLALYSLPEEAYPARAQQPAELLNAELTLDEVLGALPRLHNGRASGRSGLPAELLRHAKAQSLSPRPPSPQPPSSQPPFPQPPSQHVLAPALLAVLNSMFRTGHVPPEVNCGLVTPVFKRGDQLQTANYRAIAVTEPIMRLYASILNQRLLDYTEQNSLRAASQAGFRPQLSVVHQLFTLQHLSERQRQAGQRLYVCFMDLKGAFDRVLRPLLWRVLERLGVHGRMLEALKGLYSTAAVAVRLAGRSGPVLPSRSGVRQGCPLSPTLFGLLADGLHRSLQATAAAHGVQLSSSLSVTDLGYADDFALVSSSPLGLQHLLYRAHSWTSAVGMELSPDKSVIMELTQQQLPAYSWRWGSTQLRCVPEARYLGLLFQAGKGFLPSFRRLEQRLWASHALVRRQYGRLECERSVWLQLQLHSACVVPADSFACELWAPYPLRGEGSRGRKRLQAVHLRQVKRLAGLRQSVATPIVWEELSMRPLEHEWLVRAGRFWNALAHSGGLHRLVALDAVRLALAGTRNWAYGLREQLLVVGYAWQLSEGALPLVEMGALHARLAEQRARVWAGLAASPRLCPTEGARQCTYLRWFARPENSSASVLKQPLQYRAMRALLRFRTGCHSLPNVTGAFSGVPRSQRRCPLCDSDFPDERHVLLECAGLSAVRQRYAPLFGSTASMRDFVWQQDVVLLAKFVAECEAAVQQALSGVAG